MTDFNSLKGMVSFSENCPVVDSVKGEYGCDGKERRGTEIKKNPDVGLKVGQKVVLMDSDLRGEIVALGRKVSVELEDGLTIQVSYGEFAVTDDSEIYALKHSKVKQKKTSLQQQKVSQSLSSSLIVDLHIEAIPGGRNIPKGQQLKFQLDTFRRVVNENISHRGMKISFIHGIGDGVLRNAIRKELDGVMALRCSYSIGDPAVTIVSIK